MYRDCFPDCGGRKESVRNLILEALTFSVDFREDKMEH